MENSTTATKEKSYLDAGQIALQLIEVTGLDFNLASVITAIVVAEACGPEGEVAKLHEAKWFLDRRIEIASAHMAQRTRKQIDDLNPVSFAREHA